MSHSSAPEKPVDPDHELTELTQVARLRVTYASEVLGGGVFWEGEPGRIFEICNLVARALAQQALASRRPSFNGMWCVTPLDAQGQDIGTPVDKLAAFLRANAKSVRPFRVIPSPYAAMLEADMENQEVLVGGDGSSGLATHGSSDGA